jgi:hypothetical protein
VFEEKRQAELRAGSLGMDKESVGIFKGVDRFTRFPQFTGANVNGPVAVAGGHHADLLWRQGHVQNDNLAGIYGSGAGPILRYAVDSLAQAQ